MVRTDSKFNTYLMEYMKENHINVSTLSRNLNVGRSTVNDWIDGRNVPYCSRFQRIANELNLDLATMSIMANDSIDHVCELTYILDCLALMLGVTIKSLVDIIGIERGSFYDWKDGISHPSIDTLYKLRTALSIDIEPLEEMSYNKVPLSIDEQVLYKAAGSLVVKMKGMNISAETRWS